ncbi:hypothetical protein BGZ79_003569, partial [Entomortierella chlamydospora]
KGHSHDNGGLLSSFEDMQSDTGPECSSGEEMQLDRASGSGFSGNRESRMVEVTSLQMEWTGLPASEDGHQCIHGCFRGSLGNGNQQQGDLEIMDIDGAAPPHQLDGVASHMASGPHAINERHIICNNMMTIAQVKKFSGTCSQPLLDLTTVIWNHCMKMGMRLKTTYVPSQFNLADTPSR